MKIAYFILFISMLFCNISYANSGNKGYILHNDFYDSSGNSGFSVCPINNDILVDIFSEFD